MPSFSCEIDTVTGLQEYPLDRSRLDTIEQVVLGPYLQNPESYEV